MHEGFIREKEDKGLILIRGYLVSILVYGTVHRFIKEDKGVENERHASINRLLQKSYVLGRPHNCHVVFYESLNSGRKVHVHALGRGINGVFWFNYGSDATDFI